MELRSWLARWFGLGRLPRAERERLEAEGLRAVFEGITGSVRYGDYRAPGRRFIGRREGFVGSAAVTKRGLVAFAYGRRIARVPSGQAAAAKLDIRVDGNHLRIAAEASDLAADQSGRVEVRLRLPDPGAVLDMLRRAAP